MPAEDFDKHVCALAARKLEPDRQLWSLHASVLGELRERKRRFDVPLREAVELTTARREEVFRVVDDYLLPGAPKRRLIIVAALGGLAKTSPEAELGTFKQQFPG